MFVSYILDEFIKNSCSTITSSIIYNSSTVIYCSFEKRDLLFCFTRTLFDVQNVWGRTAVDTQKPLDTTPLSEMPRQDVSHYFFFRIIRFYS